MRNIKFFTCDLQFPSITVCQTVWINTYDKFGSSRIGFVSPFDATATHTRTLQNYT